MRLVLVGPPGAGKGTQAEILAAHFQIPHIATGDIFRANLKAGTPLGQKAKTFMDKGELVPDDVTNDLVRDRLSQNDAQSGFLLDGWPRNVTQAEVLRALMAEKKTPLDAVLEFSLSNEEIIQRLSSRRTCNECGQPSQGEKCSHCGGSLYQRDDDKPEVIAKRLSVYEEQTSPIISFYRNEGLLVTVSAIGTIDEVRDRAISALSRIRG